MSIATLEKLDPTEADVRTLADLLHDLGDIPPERVWTRPAPGEATEEDVLYVEAHLDRLCELVDGTLVEKAIGNRESFIGGIILSLLNAFVIPRRLGYVLGADSMFRFSKQLRMPDIAFVSRERWPNGLPAAPVGVIAPELAIEVLSVKNTKAEMKRKRGEYFAAGVQLVWIVDPVDLTIAVYSSPESPKVLTTNNVLDGGTVLPGFSVPVAEIFASLEK
jgi:Uma2 family endonuclease